MIVGIDTDFSLFQLNTVISAAPPFPVLHSSDMLTHESHCSLESHGVTYRNVLRESIMPSSGGFKKNKQKKTPNQISNHWMKNTVLFVFKEALIEVCEWLKRNEEKFGNMCSGYCLLFDH